MGFSKEFIFGVATAAYQIEGGSQEDGKGLSIWDVFSHTKGKIAHDENGDIACDHYHLFNRDVEVMKELGVNAYRLSISWSRVIPDGIGEVSEAGLAFYDRLIDKLIQSGIEPFVTLYHWDLPETLQQKGGWNNPEIVNWFLDYAALITKHFKGRVRKYFTFNEPQIFVGLGLGNGIHAPGYKLSVQKCMEASHNIIMAHCCAAKEMKAIDPNVLIGIASTGSLAYPKDATEKNISVAKEVLNRPLNDEWWFTHNTFCDPLVFGKYPKELLEIGAITPEQQTDLTQVFLPVDFLGFNIYNGQCVDEFGNFIAKYYGFPRSSLKWPITPEILYWGPKFLLEKYNVPCYITENGIAQQDCVCLDGKVHDSYRLDFIARYLKCLHDVVQEGVDVRGYFHWSLYDNFEWHSGYDERFGLVYVDYNTQERKIKDSGYYYAKIIETRGEILKDICSTKS